jgi:hypothetical protein
VTVWLREEYAEPRQSGSGDTYLSSVHKVQYDCAKDHSRTLLDIYYTDNNLRGTQQVEEANDDKDTIWTPIVPGTSAELDYKWACGPVSAKAHK